jgi:sugar phosphate isomerase/epimerase
MENTMSLNRRDFGKLALTSAALPAASLFAAKPNSKFDGVQIGTITYSYRDRPELANDAEGLLKLLVDSNISAIELMPPVAENFAGAPAAPARAGRGPGGPGGRGPGGPPQPAGMVVAADGSVSCPVPGPEAQFGRGGGGGGRGRGPGQPNPEMEAYAAELKKWRLSASMDKFKALRKMYNEAGVSIYCHKLTPTMAMSDDEYDYMFQVAAALGASQVSLELNGDKPFLKRLGDFALKHKMVAAYHYHTLATLTAWDEALDISKGNAVNLDCGHYVAGTGLSPIPVLEKYGKMGRIGSLHLKDRTTPAHCSLNLAWGKGDTPIGEILKTMRKNKWTFPAGIELEYEIPEGSTAVAEVRKCVDFCKKALA